MWRQCSRNILKLLRGLSRYLSAWLVYTIEGFSLLLKVGKGYIYHNSMYDMRKRPRRQNVFLSYPRWLHLRLKVFDANNWRCNLCGTVPCRELDHIKPLHKGGAKWDESNLQPLCRSCHIAKTRGENLEGKNPEKIAWHLRANRVIYGKQSNSRKVSNDTQAEART